jgi:hypothetical protein
MCRTGGRRCPSSNDPTLVAARNARRREAYASRKVVSAPAQAPLKSAEEYGFQPVIEKRQESDIAEMNKESKRELAELSADELGAVKIFTGPAHKWINNALFGRNNSIHDGDQLPEGHSGRNEVTFDTLDNVGNPSLQNLFKVVDKLDSALASHSSKERIVYRGKSSRSYRIQKEGVSAYVDKNYSLGQEVVFDGYQSTSSSPMSALDFADYSDGIIFEMKTVSGLNIISNSDMQEEQEILLPRQTRWKVVGVEKNIRYRAQFDSDNMTVVQMVEIDETGKELKERQLPQPLTHSQIQKTISTEVVDPWVSH